MVRTCAPDVSRWEEFARADPYFYIDTDFDRIRDMPDAIDRFYETGLAASDELLGEVRSLLPGHSLAIEIGCGAGRVLLSSARHFGNVRGVDVAPRMLTLLNQRATSVAIRNIQGFLPTQAWDEPAGSADYAYSLHVFQHIDDANEISAYIKRIGGALRPRGIAQLHFDTRPETLVYRVRAYIPDRFLGRTQRRGMRRIRRDPAWIRTVCGEHGLQIVKERGAVSANHWFVLRRA